ncbi:hypothetical protein [Kitasatospora aureofaciens]|uniref:hypothetical protein n=1 Tax=Kitasatospora aureofaciens TaxID=1894 RepID=UPI001C478BB0|nr:hypothetical protein [Kitasatospora aureofaciens]MBV6699866.1 hypothetical protein [Kitasatospora aureofaciens]
MTAPLLDVVLAAFADVMGEPAPNGGDTVPEDVEMWTSLTHVHLVYEIESRLDIALPEVLLVHRGSLATVAEAVRAAAG